MADHLLRVEDVAELLQLRTDRVYALARTNAIPHLRFGRTLRFRAEAIDQWLREQEEKPDRNSGSRLPSVPAARSTPTRRTK